MILFHHLNLHLIFHIIIIMINPNNNLNLNLQCIRKSSLVFPLTFKLESILHLLEFVLFLVYLNDIFQ